jgi:hypothetical protein
MAARIFLIDSSKITVYIVGCVPHFFLGWQKSLEVSGISPFGLTPIAQISQTMAESVPGGLFQQVLPP